MSIQNNIRGKNMTTNNQKPFGLQIACNLAVKAIKEGKSPPSTVLYNLLYLQQEVNFPKDLDMSDVVHFFLSYQVFIPILFYFLSWIFFIFFRPVYFS